jgi:Holliday junction resolvase
MNSRNKGKRGELEWRDVLREHGFEAERGQQRSGGSDSPDVKHTVPGVHFEVKRVENKAAGDVYRWLEQAAADCGDSIPVVAHRRSRKPWVVIMYANHFLKEQIK